MEIFSNLAKLVRGAFDFLNKEDKSPAVNRYQGWVAAAIAIAIILIASGVFFNLVFGWHPGSGIYDSAKDLIERDNKNHITLDCRQLEISLEGYNPEKVVSLEVYHEHYDQHWGDIYAQVFAFGPDDTIVGISEKIWIVENTKREDTVIHLFEGYDRNDVGKVVINVMSVKDEFLFKDTCSLPHPSNAVPVSNETMPPPPPTIQHSNFTPMSPWPLPHFPTPTGAETWGGKPGPVFLTNTPTPSPTATFRPELGPAPALGGGEATATPTVNPEAPSFTTPPTFK